MEDLTPIQSKNFRWVIPALVSIAGLMVAITLITRSNFLEGFLKLIGAGASRLQTISITSIDDFSGTSQADWLNRSAGQTDVFFSDTVALINFTGLPNDPGAIPGFVMPSISVNDINTPVIVTPAIYISPIIDLGAQRQIQSFSVLDYMPVGSQISYSYRVAATTEGLSSQTFQVLEMSSTQANGDYWERQSVLELEVPRFLQFQVSFIGYNFTQRPTMAEFNINYYDDTASETTDPSALFPHSATVILDYNPDTSLADANFRIYTKINNQEIFRQTTNLQGGSGQLVMGGLTVSPTEIYVIEMTLPGDIKRELEFTAGTQEIYTFSLEQLKAPDTESFNGIGSADLNRDGLIDSIDYSLFLNQLMNTQEPSPPLN